MKENKGTKTMDTERLTLRKFVLSDAKGMYENWATDEKVSRYVSWNVHESLEETQAIIKNWIQEYETGSYNWAVELKETGELIGSIATVSISEKHHYCEIGYCYGSRFWGQGYATEALKAVLDYLLNECRMHLVEAKHYSANPASGRVMEKAGMVKEAVLKDRRFDVGTKEYCDLVYYRKMLDF